MPLILKHFMYPHEMYLCIIVSYIRFLISEGEKDSNHDTR